MNETQLSVGTWADATFPGNDPDSPQRALRALEECVELAMACGASMAQILNTVFDAMPEDKRHDVLAKFDREPDKIAAEVADVTIVLYTLAHGLGFNIHDHVNRKMAVNRSRTWVAHGDGTGHHVKGSNA